MNEYDLISVDEELSNLIMDDTIYVYGSLDKQSISDNKHVNDRGKLTKLRIKSYI